MNDETLDDILRYTRGTYRAARSIVTGVAMLSALSAGGVAFWIAAALTANADDLDEANFGVATMAGLVGAVVAFFYLLRLADGPAHVDYIPPLPEEEE